MRTIVCGRWNKHSSARPEARALHTARNHYDQVRVHEERYSKDGSSAYLALRQAQDELTKRLLGELGATDLDFIGDGGFRHDSIFDFARSLTDHFGFEELSRIPETNHFFRQWRAVSSRVLVKGTALGYDLLFAKVRSAKPIVMTLPGPYLLARQASNTSEVGLEKLARVYAHALHAEIKFLLEQGAALVRIEDPQIIAHPEDWTSFKTAVEILTKDLDQSRLILATWYGDVHSLDGYFNLPFGAFWLDFVEGMENLKLMSSFPADKQLVAGLFDARQTYEESDDEAEEKLREIMRSVPMERLLLSANTDLHFLPWDEALGKVRRLLDFARRFKRDGSFYTISPLGEKGDQTANPTVVPHYELEVDIVSADPRQKMFGGIIYPTSTVGSFPQPQELRKARTLLRRGEMHEETYKRMVARHTYDWLEFQRELGIDLPVSGEFSREDMAAFFGTQFGGKLLDFVPSYENRRYRPVEYSDQVRLRDYSIVQDFQVAQSFVAPPIKETITGPATLADWALIRDRRYYHDRYSFRMDLARALRLQINALRAAGMRVLQVDEPALTTKMRTFDLDLLSIYETVRGLDSELYLILHICYSDMEALDQALPHIINLPFHQIHMEMANRKYSLVRLIDKHGFDDKDIGLGVVDVHTDRIETAEEIIQGVHRVRPYFRPEQIWLTPDCGFKERSGEVTRAKLRVMVEAALSCRLAVK